MTRAAFRPGAPMIPPPGRGAEEEQLLQGQLSLEDVAFRQSPLTLQIERGDYLAMADDVPDVRGVLRDGVDDRVAERLAMVVPRAFAQVIRGVLHEAGHHVLARRRDRRVG